MSREKSVLQSQANLAQKSLVEFQEKLTQAASDIATSTRQLQSAQTELKSANRRADDAEKTQKDLQAEGTNLMRSLDEMRPKIVELTAAKLELGEKVDGLEHALRNRDATIAQLESTVEEIREQKDETDKQWQEALELRENERSSAQDSSMELQKAYTELQAELDTLQTSLLSLEAERANHRQEAARRLDEIDRLVASSRAQADELASMRRELEERKHAQEEEQDYLERAHNEIESLRADVAAKNEELSHLRDAASASASPKDTSRSLDDEMLSSLRQQHALDMSAAQSNIRTLETSVFEAEAKVHSLQKHVSTLEDQLQQTRSVSRAAQRPFSPGIPSRPSSRVLDHGDLRRASFGSHRSAGNLAPPLSRLAFDQGLTPETRHKRRVSLGMLKARIESEVAAAAVGSHPPSRAVTPAPPLSTVREPISEEFSPPIHSFHRPQFLDESHVFWCHSCRGDLVVL